MKPKKQPMRMCSGCKEKKLKKELIRVVRSPEGEISLDKTGRKSGRGAYICPNIACLKMARKAKRLERSLETTIPDEVYAQLEQELSQSEE
ncbi:MAG TPA: YlxR family protein [Clostridiales bacterium]|nr:YlxR family protein [Clostridiales bacterium]